MRRSPTRGAVPVTKVRNLQRIVPVAVAALEEFAAQALRFCLRVRRTEATDLRKLREVSILLISDRRMASLHRRFHNQLGPTDVMTFRHGEIFISAETARRYARRFGNSLVQELRLYVVHGLLHLHGFDDRNEIEARKMDLMQRRILGAVLKQ